MNLSNVVVLLVVFFVTPYHTSTNVLLHCKFRSGSSRLGELFNQNPDAFYVFEPLYNTPATQHTQVHILYLILSTRFFINCLLPQIVMQILADIANTCSSNHWGITSRSNSFRDPTTVFRQCLFSKLRVVKVSIGEYNGHCS